MDILSTDGHQSPRETVGSPRVSDMRGSTGRARSGLHVRGLFRDLMDCTRGPTRSGRAFQQPPLFPNLILATLIAVA